MLCCPITSQVKGYPFGVALSDTPGIRGVILSDQVKCLDWRARDARRVGRAEAAVVAGTLARLRLLLD